MKSTAAIREAKDDTGDDVAAMLRDSAADWLARRHESKQPKGDRSQVRPVDRNIRHEMRDLGWIGLALPESLGGLDLGLREAIALCEQFGRSAFFEPYIATAVMPEFLLAAAANSPGIGSLAALHLKGAAWMSLAWQEHAGQLDVGLPHTRLDGQRLTGRKCFVVAVEADTVLLVSALSGSEPVVVAVDAGVDAIRVEPVASGIGCGMATVHFDGALVRPEGVLLRGGEARDGLARTLAAATLASAAQLAGLATAALEMTVRHVSERRQFGRAIGSFQSVQHRLVDVYASNRLAAAGWRHALQAFESGGRDADRAISAAKARCADAALQAARTSVQLHGAMGFTEEANIGYVLRAAIFHAAWLGGATQHRRRFASCLTPEILAHG